MAKRITKYSELKRLVGLLDKAEADSLKACEARAALPRGSSRARVTTANARWARHAEARDGLIEDVRTEMDRLGL